MKNKYAASCGKCGKMVAAATGETNMVGGKWFTRHLTDAACQAAPANQSPRFYGQGNGLGYDHYDDDNHFDYLETSEDVNPNEGSK